MRIFLIFISICITNFLYPCEWLYENIEKRLEDSKQDYLMFDRRKFSNMELSDMTERDAFFYLLGEYYILKELHEEIRKNSIPDIE